MRAPTVEKCANHECPERFRKIGDGKLYVFPVNDPEAWGLPKGLRQKVVWLCQDCWRHFYVRFDREAHTATLGAPAATPETSFQDSLKKLASGLTRFGSGNC